MPALRVTLEEDRARVHLVVTDPAKVEAIIRTDANGTREVRLPSNKSFTSDAPMGFLEFWDYEVALGGMVSYRLPDDEHLIWVNMDRYAPWAPRFSLALQPQVFAVAEIVTAYDAQQTPLTTYHDVIGRRDPLVIGSGLSMRRGTLVAEFDSQSALLAVAHVLDMSRTVLYRQSEHPGMDMYFHTDGLDTRTDPETGAWALHISYVEIARPSGGMVPVSGWSFEDVRSTQGSFTEVARNWDDFTALALGEK